MALEGLSVILEKQPVVPTPMVDQLLSSPDSVDAAFLKHVRSYVPFSRTSGAGEADDAVSVADFEKRLIDRIKANAAPKGYIMADFGYGETSTALYLWDRCRAARLLAIPPFQLSRLDDLIRATYAWSRYEFRRAAPALVPDLESIYQEYAERGIESDAKGDENTAATLRSLQAAGRYHLNFVATDYITFFERIVELGARAGFAGLVILPDEFQQYLDPAKRGTTDAIAPLFNIIEALNTRRGALPVGIVFSLLRKDFGLINDQRGDFIQRLKADRLGLDLGTLYDKGFAARLWHGLAAEFAFADVTDRIVTPAALNALGQIAARDDLANGPRTIIAAFTWLTRRFLERDGDGPLRPDELMDAFLAGAIVFDGASKLQTVLQTHLDNPLVASRPDFRQSAKVLASFPTDGATEPILREFGVWEATQELDRLARGDISLMVGGGLDDRGDRVPYGYTLRGLEPQSALAQDWLTQTLREFSRNFVEASERTIERIEAGFIRLLTDVVFRSSHWKLIERTDRRRTDGANQSVLFEGSFPATAKRFPERRVLVRILRDGEQPEQSTLEADVTLNVRLALRLASDDQMRRALPGTVDADVDGQALLTLNLFHRDNEDYYPDLQAALQPVVMPNRVTPLVMLALFEYLEEKRRGQLIPKDDDREIEQVYQRALLEHTADELFNAELGTSRNARGPRIIEELFREMIEARYPAYCTLMGQQNWLSALRDYQTALERLSNRHERQGVVSVAVTKEELAKLLNRSNTAIDSFIDAFPELIDASPRFKVREQSKVRFRLHPFESDILDLLKTGETVFVEITGRKLQAHIARIDLIQRLGTDLGYKQREISAVLDLMVKRELIEVLPQHGFVRECPIVKLTIEDLRVKIATVTQRTERLLDAFPDDSTLLNRIGILNQMRSGLHDAKPNDESTLLKHDRVLKHFDQEMDGLREAKSKTLRETAKGATADDIGDLRKTHRLSESIDGELFGPQLDAIRKRMLEDADALQKRREEHKSRTIEFLNQLNAQSKTDEDVIRGKSSVETLREDARQINGEAKRLDEDGRNLAIARRTLFQAIQFRANLGNDDGSDVAALFKALMARIQADLSSRKLEALRSADNWAASFDELQARVATRLNAKRESFDAHKADVLKLLRQYLGLPEAADPLRTVFNPADPAGSRHALDEEVARTIVDSFDKLSAQFETWRTEFRQYLASGELAYTDNPVGLETESRAAIKLIDGQLGAITRDLAIIQEIKASNKLDENGSVVVMRSFQHHVSAAKEVHAQISTVRAAVKLRQLELSERKLLDVVHRLEQSSGSNLDIGALIDQPELDGRTLDQIWPLVDGLYRKRRLQVHLRSNSRIDA